MKSHVSLSVVLQLAFLILKDFNILVMHGIGFYYFMNSCMIFFEEICGMTTNNVMCL